MTPLISLLCCGDEYVVKSFDCFSVAVAEAKDPPLDTLGILDCEYDFCAIFSSFVVGGETAGIFGGVIILAFVFEECEKEVETIFNFFCGLDNSAPPEEDEMTVGDTRKWACERTTCDASIGEMCGWVDVVAAGLDLRLSPWCICVFPFFFGEFKTPQKTNNLKKRKEKKKRKKEKKRKGIKKNLFV